MEPRGCNRWQPVAIARPKNGPDQAKTVATGCNRSPFGAHGKEGVSGSSPEEGFEKAPGSRGFLRSWGETTRRHNHPKR